MDQEVFEMLVRKKRPLSARAIGIFLADQCDVLSTDGRIRSALGRLERAGKVVKVGRSGWEVA